MTNLEAAERELFPVALVARSRDTVAAYEFHTSRLGAAGYASGLAVLHARALQGDAELAAMFRSPEALADVGIAAERFATPAHDREPIGVACARASAAAIASYKKAISEQLAGAEGHELAAVARRYLEAIAAEARAQAAERDRAEAARAAAEQAEAEQRAKAQAEREKLFAEQAEAAKQARSAEAAAAAATRAYADTCRRRLAAELQAARVKTLRLRIGGTGGKYGIPELLAALPRLSLAEINAVAEALEAAEGEP